MRSTRLKVHLALALIVSIGALGAVLYTRTTPKLGLDLEGGTSVILTASGENLSEDTLNQAVDIIRRRIDALGVAEPEVTIAGSDNILIQLPGVEDERKALDVIGTTAQLTFRQVEEMVPPGSKPKDRPEVTEDTSSAVNDEEVVYPDSDGTLYRLKPAVLTGDAVAQAEAVPDPNTGGPPWTVQIDLRNDAADAWAEFTSDLACLRDEGEQIKSQVAIVLDGVVESAAGMADPATSPGGGVTCGEGIGGGDTQIDVGDEQEAKDLALVLRFGALPVSLEQSEVQKVSPTLGRDSLEAGLRAGIIGLALVMLYVLVYYRALGVVVWAGLAVFTASIYSLVSVLSEGAGLTLSLAGVAGLIVSIGITADSYIVAFERLKDEVRSGKTLRAAVERGMVRAFRTILVADFVTGSAAVILFFLAVGPVKGFALTLGLATIIDVLVAYFFTRPAVQLLARTRVFTAGRVMGMRAALGMPSS